MAGTFGINRKVSTAGVFKNILEGCEASKGRGSADSSIVLSGARGTRIRDADGNRFLDLSSFFGVGVAGHRNPAIMRAASVAQGHLVHAMGDVHPDRHRARLLKELCALMPEPGYRGLLSLNGSDAVETALKYAAAATGRGGIISFEGAYHGLTAGALEATWREDFRRPFEATLAGRAVFSPWPAVDGSDLDRTLDTVDRLASTPLIGKAGRDFGRPGALIVEPIQGRGGIRVPPPGFLTGLAEICARKGIVFITDEIYCGTWRTGTFLAGEIEQLRPDIVCLGKALGGGFPLSVAMMKPWVDLAVPSCGSEAAHTSTFAGWPVSCAAATAMIRFMKGCAPAAAAAGIEEAVTKAAGTWRQRFDFIRGIRGRGAMLGIEIGPYEGISRAQVTGTIVKHALKDGVIVLPEGMDGEVIAVTPPLITDSGDMATALGILETAMTKVLK